MCALFVGNDYNGECFIVGTEGELEQTMQVTNVIIPDGLNYRNDNAYTAAELDLFFRVNLHHLNALPGDPELTHQNMARICYLRMLILRTGAYMFHQAPGVHHCRYTDFVQLTNLETVAHVMPAWFAAERDAILNVAWRNSVIPKLTNMVCCVAYMFRVRAHHYLEEFQARYNSLWRKCLYNEDNPGLDWKFISRHVLHAVFPDTLDIFWAAASENSRCAGTLRKRFNCAPAGVAGVAALRKGIDDLFMVFPLIKTRNAEAVAHLEAIEEQVRNHRWAGSVNRRYYNAPEIIVDEARLASLAAAVLGACEAFADNSPLKGSQALQRLASNARITQGVIERILEKASGADTMVLAVVPPNVV
jgi:hypothetical protein